LDTGEDLIGHPLEGFILFLLTILVDLSMDFLTWVVAFLKESWKVLLQGLSPQELKVVVLMNEVLCSILDLKKVISHDLHGTE